MMAQSRAESTRDTCNYGQYINQFPPNTIKVIREFERIQEKICRHKMSIIFNEICIYIHIYIYIYKIAIVETMVLKSQLREAEQFFWIGNHRLPRNILCSPLTIATRKIRYKDCLKKSFGSCYIDHHLKSTLAENCTAWRLTTNLVVSTFENTHRAVRKDKRRRRRNQYNSGQIFSLHSYDSNE